MNEEAIWIAQAQQGSDEAFTCLVEAYQTHVYNLCHRMLGEAESAEDAAQETFLRAYQHLHRYDSNRPSPPGCFPSPPTTVSTACAAGGSRSCRWRGKEARMVWNGPTGTCFPKTKWCAANSAIVSRIS